MDQMLIDSQKIFFLFSFYRSTGSPIFFFFSLSLVLCFGLSVLCYTMHFTKTHTEKKLIQTQADQELEHDRLSQNTHFVKCKSHSIIYSMALNFFLIVKFCLCFAFECDLSVSFLTICSSNKSLSRFYFPQNNIKILCVFMF